MKSNFKVFQFNREQEVVYKISSLFQALNYPEPRRSLKVCADLTPVPWKKCALRNKSFHPRVTIFDFTSSKLVKPPVASDTSLPGLQNPTAAKKIIKKRKGIKRVRERIIYISKEIDMNHRKCISVEHKEYDKYGKILRLAEDMINKENIEGWSDII